MDESTQWNASWRRDADHQKETLRDVANEGIDQIDWHPYYKEECGNNDIHNDGANEATYKPPHELFYESILAHFLLRAEIIFSYVNKGGTLQHDPEVLVSMNCKYFFISCRCYAVQV